MGVALPGFYAYGMDPVLLDQLRTDLSRAEYTEATVRTLLGEAADAARLRGVRAPARIALQGIAARAEAGNQPLGESNAAGSASTDAALRTLVQLFLVGDPVTETAFSLAFPTLGAVGATALGLVTSDDVGLRAALALSPFHATGPGLPEEGTDWWLLSDLDDHIRRGPARTDHVMGVGGATRSLLGFAAPGTVDSALDLGTGCGVIALHLAARARRVVAIDISARALEFAQANARINAVSGIDFRRGDLFAPVARERFDLILSNPPFVITPRDGSVPDYEYRDGGRSGDDLIAQVLQAAPDHLKPGGTLQCLGNWEVRWGADGLERVLSWIEEAPGSRPVDAAWVIERDRQRPEGYAELWARDGGARPGTEAFDDLVAAWLADFAARRVVAIGLGLIGFRRGLPGNPQPAPRRAERADGAIGGQDRLGDRWSSVFATNCAVDPVDSVAFGELVLERDSSVREERVYEPGAEHPMSIVLASDEGIARRVHADTVLAAAVGACDGDLTVDEIGTALTGLLDADPIALRDALHAGLRELIWYGMLVPASAASGGAPDAHDSAVPSN